MTYYRYIDGSVPAPIPHVIRKTVTAEDVEELWSRESLSKADTKEEKIIVLSDWAVSYKKAFDLQQTLIDELHMEALRYHEALEHVRKEVVIIRKDAAASLRLMGSGVQQVKVRFFGFCWFAFFMF